MGIFKKQSAKNLFNDVYAMFLCVYVCFIFVLFFLIFFIEKYVVGTHLNCTGKSMQFKWVPTTYAFIKKKVDKKYTGCNLKTTELLNFVLIGICVLIMSNTVISTYPYLP